jgi:hypothetical protein
LNGVCEKFIKSVTYYLNDFLRDIFLTEVRICSEDEEPMDVLRSFYLPFGASLLLLNILVQAIYGCFPSFPQSGRFNFNPTFLKTEDVTTEL